jgi:hypothetical protein
MCGCHAAVLLCQYCRRWLARCDKGAPSLRVEEWQGLSTYSEHNSLLGSFAMSGAWLLSVTDSSFATKDELPSATELYEGAAG